MPQFQNKYCIVEGTLENNTEAVAFQSGKLVQHSPFSSKCGKDRGPRNTVATKSIIWLGKPSHKHKGENPFNNKTPSIWKTLHMG